MLGTPLLTTAGLGTDEGALLEVELEESMVEAVEEVSREVIVHVATRFVALKSGLGESKTPPSAGRRRWRVFGKSIRRVVSREENICASDSVTGARRSVVERSIVRSNHQEEDTSHVETTEPLIGVNIPLSKNMLLGGSHRVTMQHSLNPIESPSGQKTINSGAHYYVEEPESPRSIQRADGLGPGSGDKPNDPYVAPLLSCPVREVGLKNLGEEILAYVFQKALNLKRENSYSPEKVDEGKKQKRLLLEDYESSNRSMEEDVAGIEETLRIRSSVARGGACRARGRRGGRSRGRLAGGRGVQHAQLSDSELVEVNVGEESGILHARGLVSISKGDASSEGSKEEKAKTQAPALAHSRCSALAPPVRSRVTNDGELALPSPVSGLRCISPCRFPHQSAITNRTSNRSTQPAICRDLSKKLESVSKSSMKRYFKPIVPLQISHSEEGEDNSPSSKKSRVEINVVDIRSGPPRVEINVGDIPSSPPRVEINLEDIPSSPPRVEINVEDISSCPNRVEINLADLPSDPGLRPRIMGYNPNLRDQVRRLYLQKGPCQPRSDA
ncbi:hypothetical protein RHGRI_013586 [Rhododendron griersonianum]|uniref:Uncharacterized protein n=1 Tax=Rhododendron griersonianum TaxID=479676 RepID=A0AAV6K686_9ERIC|nr:hypothetical protein RHGRI_013586 [Rhododendron griersonianum]